MKGTRKVTYRLVAVMASIAAGSLLSVPGYADEVPTYSLDFDPSADKYSNPLQSYTRLGTADPLSIVFTIVNTSLIFLGSITLILIIVAGFMWLTAAGVEEKITKAKDILKGAVVGLVVVLGSYGLAQYLFTAIRIATVG